MLNMHDRRVREAPGGKDSLSTFWDDGGNAQETFVPTRRYYFLCVLAMNQH